MSVVLRHQGREVTEADVAFIRELIAAHPGESRRSLSKHLCAAWDWRQTNGQPRDMVCRGLMLALHRAGKIDLPPVRCRPKNNAVLKRRRPAVEVDETAIDARLQDVGPLTIRMVRRTTEERIYDSLIEKHHYLGYGRPVGEHLKYLVFAAGRPIACLGFSSPPRHLGPRDRFIGWSARERRRNTRLIAYNTRFLILPWVRVRHLASHVLSRVSRAISKDWEKLYGHPVYYLETFIDPARFRGTCYRAANWISLGETTGRGHNARTHRATQPKKEVLGFPLVDGFREHLSCLS